MREYESVKDGGPASATPTLPHTLTVPPSRLFIPSRLADNPHLDVEAYRRSLVHLAPVERERLLAGDWNVQEKALVRPESLRYYNFEHETVNLLQPDGRVLVTIDSSRCRRFVTVDPAGTSADRAREIRGRQPSYTVAQVWDQPRGRDWCHLLILRHQVRGLLEYPQIVHALHELHRQWAPERIWIEDERLGRATIEILKKELPIAPVRTGCKDKATRAARLLRMFEAGQIFLPQFENTWRHDFEAELLSWTGDERQPTDQIDAAAYAAIVAQESAPGIIVMQPIVARDEKV